MMDRQSWVIFLFSACCLLLTSSRALAIYEFPVCTAAEDQWVLEGAVSNDIVVWTDYRNGSSNGDIYAYDLSTGREVAVCIHPSEQDCPKVSGSIVVWRDFRNDSDGPAGSYAEDDNADIYGCDLATGEEFSICTDPHGQLPPDIWGSIVVWSDTRNVDISGYDVYGYDLATGMEFAICTANGQQYSPCVWGNTVVWVDSSNDLYTYDLRNARISYVLSHDIWDIAMSGHTVVWCDSPPWFGPSDQDIYGCDLAIGEVFSICTTAGGQRSPDISGNIVAWHDIDYWGNMDIYGYDLADHVQFPICTAEGKQFSPAASGNLVVWTDHRSDPDTGYDVYGAVLDDRYNPPDGPGAPDAFQPYVAYVTTQPVPPLNGYDYGLKIVVRNHGGQPGEVTIALDELNLSGIVMDEDYISPDPPVRTRPLDAYGEEVFYFLIRHKWEWIAEPPETWQAVVDGAISVLPISLIQDWAGAIQAAGNLKDVKELKSYVSLVMEALRTGEGTVRDEAQFRYLPGSGTTPGIAFDETVTVRVGDWKTDALWTSVGHSLAGTICSKVGSSAGVPGLPLLALQAVLKYAAHEYYKIAYDPAPSYQVLPEMQTIEYPELDALSDSPGKAAALAAKAWLEVELAGTQAWVRMAAAEEAQDDYWRSRQAQAAHEFGELAEARLAEYQRLLAAVPGLQIAATPGEIAAFKAQLQSDGLPDIERDFLLREGWTQGDLDALVQSMIDLDDEWYQTPHLQSDASVLGVAGAHLQTVNAYQFAETPKVETEAPITRVVVSGDMGGDGQFVSDVAVRLMASPPPRDEISSIEYSLDSGDTWLPYETEIVITENGATEVLARATAEGGALEDPPARRVIWKRAPVFDDVPPEHWAWDSVERCYWHSVVQGYEDGYYHPEVEVTRDQMAVYITRSLDVPTGQLGVVDYEPPAASSFTDVPVDHWAYRHIEYAAARDVVQGYPEGDYRPDAVASRDQMAVYVARAKGWVGIDEDMSTAPEVFPDVPAGFWAGTAVQACVDNAVVHGYDDGYYRPDVVVTRDQMAVYVARAFDLTL